MDKKGAMQMSLGFIIAIVFGIVMLTLLINWIQSTFTGVGGLTTDLTQQAQSSLRDAFRQTGSNFAVWPSQYEVEAGGGIRMSAGIENDAPESKTHYYILNVIPAAVSENICAGAPIDQCTNTPTGQNMRDFMRGWVTVAGIVSPYQTGTTGFQAIDIAVPREAQAGTYLFNAVACYDGSKTNPQMNLVPTQSNCDPSAAGFQTDKLWGNPQPIVIVVTK